MGVTGNGAPARGLTTQLTRIIEKSPGINLYVEDMAQTCEVSTTSINQAMYRVKAILPGLESVATGIYRYNGPGHNGGTAKLFEQIGVTKAGVIVLQDEDGNLYRAEEIK